MNPVETNNDKPLGLDDCAAMLAAWIAIQDVHEKSPLIIVKNRLIEMHRERLTNITMDVTVLPALSREEVKLFLFHYATAVRHATSVDMHGELYRNRQQALIEMENDFLKHFDPKPHYTQGLDKGRSIVLKNGHPMKPDEIVSALSDLTERAR
jgi:hypothetical protein